MFQTRFHKYSLLFSIIFVTLLILFAIYFYIRHYQWKESMKNVKRVSPEYIQTQLKDPAKHMFPFRYFQDPSSNVLPIVAVTGFFREDKAKQLYFDYVNAGVTIIGITAYKSFPKKIEDGSDDAYHLTDDFDYTKNIKDWLCCLRYPENSGFTSENNWVDISESDLYDVETVPNVPKKYDFIYICNKDSDTCPLDGWNAVNRNFKLAKECLPILVNEYELKGLIVGRVGCGLEQQYGNKIEVSDWLDWGKLQEKMRECRFIFVPNIFDASPRVVAECITKGLAVLMNRNILCGSKYVAYDTGEVFTDENDIRGSIDSLLMKIDDIDPRAWWAENYGVSRTAKKIRNFIYPLCPDVLEDVQEVRFIL